ncbi:hypothetical protein [Ekhidna sp.]|uniref:hypothetical protein n=1 Tax=Ekhidna sp. TaxID=2608089 RepID=UPI0032991D32
MSSLKILQTAFKNFAGISEEAFDLSSNYWHEKSFKKGELFNNYKNVDSGFEKHLLKGADMLFMLKDKFEFFTKKHWMFPVLSHA